MRASSRSSILLCVLLLSTLITTCYARDIRSSLRPRRRIIRREIGDTVTNWAEGIVGDDAWENGNDSRNQNKTGDADVILIIPDVLVPEPVARCEFSPVQRGRVQ